MGGLMGVCVEFSAEVFGAEVAVAALPFEVARVIRVSRRAHRVWCVLSIGVCLAIGADLIFIGAGSLIPLD